MGLKNSRLLHFSLVSTFFESRDAEMITEDDCYDDDDGTFDDNKYSEYLDQEDDRAKMKKKVLLPLFHMIEREVKAKREAQVQLKQMPIKKTRKARPKYYIDPKTQKRLPLSPKISFWWLKYIQDPQPDNLQWSKSFIQRFRLPYSSYLDVLDLICHGDLCGHLFERWRTPEDAYFRRGNN